jgi:hypothetical protein
LFDKIAVLEKCNNDVFRELDESINQLNKSQHDLSISRISPNKQFRVETANPNKQDESLMFDKSFEGYDLIKPLDKPEEMRKSADGNFAQKVMIENDGVKIIQLE